MTPPIFDPRWYGVYPARVTDIQDPDGIGRVKVALAGRTDASGHPYEAWARMATLMAGRNAGSFFLPDRDSEVLVAFEGGDPSTPYVVGALWNSDDTPPASANSRNSTKVLRSRNGVTITVSDDHGQERLRLETPNGQMITLRDGPGAIEIQDANGNAVTLSPTGVSVQSSAMVTVNASQVKVSAGMVKVDAGMTKFSGTVMADTVICNSVVASSYTPGAGNIW